MLTNIIEVTLIISICTVIAYIVPIIFFTPIFPIMVGMDLVMPLDKIFYWTIITFTTAILSSLLPFYKILKLQPTEVFRRAT